MKSEQKEHHGCGVNASSCLQSGPKNVTEIVVPSDMCIGCGVCAAVCPARCLSISLNNRGEFEPQLIDSCRPKCDLCLRVCPFYQGSVTLDDIATSLYGHIQGISRNGNVGYYLSSWAGYSPEHRQRSASGGLTTWLLEELLLTKAVDRVICVLPDNTGGLLSRASVSASIEEVRKAAGSRYHPIELSEALRIVREDNEYRYAITGLPCFLHAVRLASQYDRRLARRVRFLLGLVCGHCPGFFYTEALLSLTGHKIDSCRSVDYRCKEGTDSAGDFRFRVLDKSGLWSKGIPFSGIPGFLWLNNYFTNNSCNFCDDVFAEVADAVFMDAWLGSYSKNPAGTSIVVVRNPELHDVIVKARESGRCNVEPISVSEVIRSQKELVYQKKTQIAARIAWATSKGRWLPPMRIAPSCEIYNSDRHRTDLRMSIIASSKRLWPIFRCLRSCAIWPFLITTWCLQGRNAIRLSRLYDIFPAARLIPWCWKRLKNWIRSIKKLGTIQG